MCALAWRLTASRPSLQHSGQRRGISTVVGATQTNRQAFYVYRDADSGFNHGFPSGFFGTTSKIHIDTAAIDDTNSTRGVSTNLNVLDRHRGNVLQVVFAPFSPGQFAGVNFEEPQGGGSGQIGLGYDLEQAVPTLCLMSAIQPATRSDSSSLWLAANHFGLSTTAKFDELQNRDNPDRVVFSSITGECSHTLLGFRFV